MNKVTLHILNKALEHDFSDLIISPMQSLKIEKHGELIELTDILPGNKNYLSPFQTAMISFDILSGKKHSITELQQTGSADISFAIANKARFRTNIFLGKRQYSLVLRKLNSEIPTLKNLKSPEILQKISQEKNGLVLVTGATGSGKSTTLAALLRDINENQHIHIITLEDPIEFSHTNIKATFNQRELGSDFNTFPNGLRAALRQAPKVILVGEMRDRETIEIAITAAETGHLVLSTLHTNDAGSTINRIVGMFSKDEENQIRERLAKCLRWVVSQRLINKKTGGRAAVHEIMGVNIRVEEVITKGESDTKNYPDIINSSSAYGWQIFETAIANLFKKGEISEKTALDNSTRKAYLRQIIDSIKSQTGQSTTSLKDLKIDKDHLKNQQ
jgi:twitching motility protein PilT